MSDNKINFKIIFSSLLNRYKKFFSTGHERSVRAKKNIVALLLRQGLGIVISFLMVPLLISCLDQTRYGIWITISSFIAWFNFFDIGLGNGLRNKLAESLAHNDIRQAKIYVSTTYAIISMISFALVLIFFIVNPFISWKEIFNASSENSLEIESVMLLVFSFFCLQFIIRLISTVLVADQKPAVAAYFNTIGSTLALVITYIISRFYLTNIFTIALIFSISNFIVPLVASFWFFGNRYKDIAPSLKSIDFKCTSGLMNLGIKFFIIQGAAIIIYSTNNMIISQLFSPAEVTPFNIAFKYFSVVTMVWAIILTPFWSAFTEAYTKGDIKWIKSMIKKLKSYWLLTVLLSLTMLLLSKQVYSIWIGDKIHVPFMLSMGMCLFVTINGWITIFVNFLNGTGKVKIQLISALFGAVFSIPLSILFAKTLSMGPAGVIYGTFTLSIISAIWAPLQYYKIINNTANGIWNK
jgi:O-antigen/teichoic acid export membrane protein